jgi:hypothetical protein
MLQVEAITESQRAMIAERLGRRPRGLREIAVSDAGGRPMVIRVASLVDGKPFPTLYWLIDPALRLRIDREEAGGTISAIQQQIDASDALRDALQRDHLRHIEQRLSYITPAEREQLETAGMWDAVACRGIGGIADFGRIRCLHTWYAAHLVDPNTVGRLLDERWAAAGRGI